MSEPAPLYPHLPSCDAALQRLEALNAEAFALRYERPKRSLQLVSEAVELARSVGGEAWLAELFHTRSLAYFYLSDFESSADSALRALSRARPEDHRLLGRCYFLLGACLGELAQHRESVDNFLRSLPHSQAAGDETVHTLTLLNLSVLQCKLGQHRAALEGCRQVLRRRKHLSVPQLCQAICVLAEVHLWLERPDRAAAAGHTALRLLQQHGLIDFKAQVFFTLAAIHEETGDLARATRLYGEAYRMAGRTGHQSLKAKASFGMAKLLRARGRHTAYLEQLEETVRLARQIKHLELLVKGHRLLAEARHSAGQTAEGQEHARLADYYQGMESNPQADARHRALLERVRAFTAGQAAAPKPLRLR
ncbi:tetratricopeptide (TPR) repeat protein [Deinobacterium chartae]|uniref:Tetratricopeptide (TPR) repeat protein n=1 Tax=Deinobacterium chartae TaxID=521158 RepID=A0A841I3L9_9DEIO|nr:hypothetical protein [Deinobacterium chartae]MBB6099634.1 tetratricopeptide (TPR) repeat protein [Deinobacterium chartae]